MNQPPLTSPDGDKPPAHVLHQHSVDFSLLSSGYPALVVEAELRYHTQDPHAVAVSFWHGGLHWVEWSFARDLLVEGLRGPAGEGDVRIRPAKDDPELIHFRLDAPAGSAEFGGDRGQLARFLDCTARLVPLGEETRWQDVDSFLTRLFTGTQ